MKTSMFKNFTKEERRNKIERILRKKTDQRITEEMLDAIFRNVDLSNQLFINYFDWVNKFDKACILKIENVENSSIIRIEEKPETIYGDLQYIKNIPTPIYSTNKPQIVLKTRKNLFSNQTSEWDYILLIYIPEEK